LAKAKKQQQDYGAELQKSFDQWDHLNVHGGSDPGWSDGVNMNLVRNHISNWKRKNKEEMSLLPYPEIFYRETPPEVDRDYMARVDEIRENAKLSLAAYKTAPDYQYLCRRVTRLTERQKKDTSIVNVIGYATGLENAIERDDLVHMRRHERASRYLDSFVSCAERVRKLEFPENEQTNMFADYSDDVTDDDEDAHEYDDIDDEIEGAQNFEHEDEDEAAYNKEHNPISREAAPIENQDLDKATETSPQTASSGNSHPTPTIDHSAIIAFYARNAEVSAPRAIGASVLMTPVFDDGNFNRTGKKIRVTVEEPIGKYQLFRREENGSKALYFLTASGRIDRTAEYFRDEWNEQNRKWVNTRPTEAELDEVIPQIAERFESDMAVPTRWAKYQHAAVLNRLDECEAHNAPVRELRNAEEQRRQEEAELERKAEQRRKQDEFATRVDEIAKAIEKGETIGAAYDEDKFDGKNPVLDLFKLYNISLPLRTQGWVNTRLAEITSSGYRYFSGKRNGNSTTFGEHLNKLRDAIRLEPIELRRQHRVGDTEVTNTMEKQNYQRFSELFPKVTSSEYSYLRLEAGDGMMPLSVEWTGQNRISVMHTYKMNGDLMYDPMMSFEIDSNAKTLRAVEFEQSLPPLYQRIDDHGIGYSVDSSGNERTVKGLQHEINDFASQWLDNIGHQDYVPVRGTVEIDGEDIRITFDKSGNTILPKPEKQYDINYGHLGNGLTVWNRLEEKDGDYVKVAHIGPDRVVKFYDNDMPDDLKIKINIVALTSDARVSTSQPQHHVFDTPPHEYPLIYNEIPGIAVEVFNKDAELVANVHGNGRVEYIQNIPPAAQEELAAFAENMANEREAHFLNFDGDAYAIYLFEPKKDDSRAIKDNYRLAWFGAMDEGETLDTVRERFAGEDSPFYDFHGRENGVRFGNCDMIVTKQNGEITPWFVNELSYYRQADFYKSMNSPDNDKIHDNQAHDNSPMPDPTIGLPEMNSYGYTCEGMLPLTEDFTLEFFDGDYCVYLLYQDGTEALAENRDEIPKHSDRGGIFGIEGADWESSREFAAIKAASKHSEGSMEADLLYGSGNRFGIYQIRDDLNTETKRNVRFTPLNELAAVGLDVERSNYKLVYTAPFSERVEFLTDRYPVLNRVFVEFNTERPDDYTGRSVSVSDVIVLKYNDGMSSHFVDSTGFVEIDGFLGEEKAILPAQTAKIAPASAIGRNIPEADTANIVDVLNVQTSQAKTEQPAYSRLGNSFDAKPGKMPQTQKAAAEPKTAAKKPTLMERLEVGKQKAAQGENAGLPKIRDSVKE